MNKQYTSLELSKKLKENGCNLESDRFWDNEGEIKFNSFGDPISSCKAKNFKLKDYKGDFDSYPAYDILWDISIKYKEQFFGLIPDKKRDNCYYTWVRHTEEILWLINQGKSQELIEEYIWSNCRFNLNNKEK